LELLDGRLTFTALHQHKAEVVVRIGVIGIELNGFSKRGRGAIHVGRALQRQTELGLHRRRIRNKSGGPLIGRDRTILVAECLTGIAEVVKCPTIIRIQFSSQSQFLLRRLEVPDIQMHHSKMKECLLILGVNL
jgi:hypothetical protein